MVDVNVFQVARNQLKPTGPRFLYGGDLRLFATISVMDISRHQRQLHALAAGLLALLVYVIVFVLTSRDSATWNFFGNCQDVVGAIFCILAGSLAILIKLITIGLPVAIVTSAVYLKAVKFSMRAALLLPFLANLSVVMFVILIWKIIDVALPLWIIAVLIPLTYIALSCLRRNTTQ